MNKVVLILTCVVCCSLSRAFLRASPEGKQVKPAVILSGVGSNIKSPRYELIGTPDDLKRVWSNHLGTTTSDEYGSVLQVDFDDHIVVVVFMGARVNVRGITVEPLIETADSMIIRFSELAYQTGGPANNNAPDRPYAFIVLPKAHKSIVLEENIQQYKNQPPEWKERAKLGVLNR